MLGDPATLPQVMALRRRNDPRLHALMSDESRITYLELDDASRALAGRLIRAGLNKGDRVGLLMHNGIDWATTAVAVMRVGGVLVPLSTLLRAPELHAQLGVAGVTHLIAVRDYRSRSYLEDLRSLSPDLEGRVRIGRRDPLLPALRQIWIWPELPEAGSPPGRVEALEGVVRPADDMVVLFTSGSRGAPKGVIHTHGSALRATAAGLEARCIGARERLYIPMPFFWTGGFCGGLLSVLLAGATLLTESTPEPGQTIRFLERERATLFRGWPDQAARIAAHPAFAAADLSSLRP
ncbi:MAG TPA: class I adenylate-forming enzyme family protein, partial [Myxococcota bacterium]|nr:class I adenylate-forming enzyme family protein [Myxococcota bacterium]